MPVPFADLQLQYQTIKREIDTWGRVVKAADIRAE